MAQRVRLGGGAAPSKRPGRRPARGGISLGRKVRPWQVVLLALLLVGVVFGGLRVYHYIKPAPLSMPPPAASAGGDYGTDLMMHKAGEAAKKGE